MAGRLTYCVSGLSEVAWRAVEIGSDFLRFLLADLDGREIGKARVSLERPSSAPPVVCKRIGEAVRDLLRNQHQPEEQLLGLVVGVPAIVNVQEGVVMALSALKGLEQCAFGRHARQGVSNAM